MKNRHSLFACAPVALAIAAGAVFGVTAIAQNASSPDPMAGMPPMPPAPGEHHAWLQRFVGSWTIETEMTAEGMPPMTCTGVETVRSIGGRWIMSEMTSEMPGVGPMHAVLTLGYNAEEGKYQGTWIDSFTDHLWVYEGTLDPTGRILTLEAKGPNMMDPTAGDTVYRDVVEFKSADHRTMSSFMRVDGEWVQFVSSNARRKK